MNRRKLADLTSGMGALAVGMGIGALFATWLASTAGLIAIAGVVAHAFGMWDKHRLEVQDGADGGPVVAALYWVCWLLLGGVVAFVAVSR